MNDLNEYDDESEEDVEQTEDNEEGGDCEELKDFDDASINSQTVADMKYGQCAKNEINLPPVSINDQTKKEADRGPGKHCEIEKDLPQTISQKNGESPKENQKPGPAPKHELSDQHKKDAESHELPNKCPVKDSDPKNLSELLPQEKPTKLPAHEMRIELTAELEKVLKKITSGTPKSLKELWNEPQPHGKEHKGIELLNKK